MQCSLTGPLYLTRKTIAARDEILLGVWKSAYMLVDYTTLCHHTWDYGTSPLMGKCTRGREKRLPLMSARLSVSGALKSSRARCTCVLSVRSRSATPLSFPTHWRTSLLSHRSCLIGSGRWDCLTPSLDLRLTVQSGVKHAWGEMATVLFTSNHALAIIASDAFLEKWVAKLLIITSQEEKRQEDDYFR